MNHHKIRWAYGLVAGLLAGMLLGAVAGNACGTTTTVLCDRSAGGASASDLTGLIADTGTSAKTALAAARPPSPSGDSASPAADKPDRGNQDEAKANGPGAAVSTVPEPATIGFLAVGAAVAVLRRRRRGIRQGGAGR